MIQLLSGPHLVVVTSRKSAGSILGKDIWLVTSTKTMPCATVAHQKLRLNSDQVEDELRYVDLLEHFLATTGIYYSAAYNLTRSLQAQASRFSSVDGPAFGPEDIDFGYFLNKHLAEPFLRDPKGSAFPFLSVCIEGFVELQPTFVNQHKLRFGLVSRRAVGRIGTRHFSRGIDEEGHVSNFVETEQLVISDSHIGSFVQIRGSIPIYWRQNVNLLYKPPLELYNLSENSKVFKAHFQGILNRFGRLVAVNLVDRTGFEGILAKHFATEINTLNEPNLRYVHFDFHQNCRKMQWHKISLLMDTIEVDLKEQGYCLASIQSSSGLKLISKQQGVVRTNCIDCLDRTNVVQGVIAQRTLNLQLHQMGIFNPEDSIQQHADLVWFFKNIWADNGDSISKQYAGTGALKTDFTRTGRRTAWGALQDGWKSAIRYYKTNFTDGYRQDAMDLFHGRYLVDPSLPSPFVGSPRSFFMAGSPGSLLGTLLLLSYLTSWALSKTGAGKMLPRPLILVASLLPATLFLAFALNNGAKFVLYPKFNPPQPSSGSWISEDSKKPFLNKVHLI